MDKYGITISDDDQAAITKTAKQFIKDNKDEGLEALGATQDVVERYLYLYTVANRAYDKITADVDFWRLFAEKTSFDSNIHLSC